MQDNTVRVKSLELKNFRGFKELKLEFSDKPVVVFFGENGAGKSTALDAIRYVLEKIIYEITQTLESNLFNPNLNKNYIKNNEDFSSLFFDLKIYNKIFSIKSNFKRNPFKINFQVLNKAIQELEEGDIKDFTPNETYERKLIKDEKIAKYLETNFSEKLPLFSYYSTTRAIFTDNSIDFKNLSSIEPLYAYDKVFQGKTDFKNFFNWYKFLEDEENAARSDALLRLIENKESINDLSKDSLDKQLGLKLHLIQKAINKFIPYFDTIKIKRESSKKISIIVDKNSQSYDLNQLSQGEKMLLAMVGDIALRLVILNPKLDDPLLGSGIILIDEIDLHLHPAWQRRVLKNLHKTFPNCQFIVTTHSPQVLGETEMADVFLLSSNDEGDLEAEKVDHIYGKDSNEILESFMDVSSRNEDMQEQLDDLLDFIQDGEFDQAKTLLLELEEKLGLDDIELMKARLFLRKMRLLNEKNNKKP